MTVDRHLGIALGGSLTVHAVGVVIAILLLWFGLLSLASGPGDAADPAPDEREITMLIPETITLEPRPEERKFVEARTDQELETAPENAAFQSDANTSAASRTDPTNGDDARPALDGRDAANIELRTKRDSPDVPEPKEETANLPDEKPQAPPAIGDMPDESILPPDDTAVPKPASKPDETTAPDSSKASDASMQTKLDGGAEKTESASAVDAEATPRGKYMVEVKAAIGRQWHAIIAKRGRPTPGILKVRLSVSRDGSIDDIQIVDDSADGILKNAAMDAVLEARVPEMPDEVLKTLRDGHFIVEYEFVSY